MHVAVIGAGAFGGWTALHLLERGANVTLVDAWGPGNSRSSSSGESRIIRSIYGDDELSVRFAVRSLELWRDYEERWQTRLFVRTGMLFLAGPNDEFLSSSERILSSHGVVTERWTAREGSARYPQISFDDIDSALFEPNAGILTARKNCRTLLKHFVAHRGDFLLARVERLHLHSELKKLRLSNASELQADAYVFACGAWLPRMFPEALAGVIRPTQQDVLFVGTPPGDGRFSVPEFPCWADRTSDEKFYGLPDLQHRGFKIASDLRGPDFDPDSDDRIIEARSWTQAKEFLRRRFPALDRAPLVESRVCQYENTPDLALLIDRHPAASNVWLLGGGSGHGYKQGPAVGEYVAGLVNGTAKPVPEFALERFRHATRHPVSSI